MRTFWDGFFKEKVMDYTKKITEMHEGQKFLRNLNTNGKAFHLDDDVNECFKIGKDGDLTLEEANLLTKRQQELHSINWGMFGDCHGFHCHIHNDGLDTEGNFYFKHNFLDQYTIQDVKDVFNAASKNFDHEKYLGCNKETGALTFGHIDDIQEWHSGGGFYHLFILLQSGHVISHSKADKFLEISKKKWESILKYYESDSEDEEDGFGYEANNDDHENRCLDFSLNSKEVK